MTNTNTDARGRTQSPRQIALWDGSRATFIGRGKASYTITIVDDEGVYTGQELVVRLAYIVERRHHETFLVQALRDKVSGATLSTDHLIDRRQA